VAAVKASFRDGDESECGCSDGTLWLYNFSTRFRHLRCFSPFHAPLRLSSSVSLFLPRAVFRRPPPLWSPPRNLDAAASPSTGPL